MKKRKEGGKRLRKRNRGKERKGGRQWESREFFLMFLVALSPTFVLSSLSLSKPERAILPSFPSLAFFSSLLLVVARKVRIKCVPNVVVERQKTGKQMAVS